MLGFALETLVDDILSQGRQAQTLESGMGPVAAGEKSSASTWSLVLAGAKVKPVITPWGLTQMSKWKPSYQLRRLLQRMSA